MAKYQELLASLRNAFPQPVSDPVHDAYFVFSISRALDQVDALKSQAPIVGAPSQPDWQGAKAARIAADGISQEEVIRELVSYLEGMFIWGHPRSQVNVVPPPSIASIIGVLLPTTYNPNLVSEEGGHRISEAEVRVVSMAADLVGYNAAQASGLFTFGGTGAMLYAARIGLEKALPGCHQHGLHDRAVILASDGAHYSVLNVAGWLGLGIDNVILVPTHSDNAINVEALEQAARQQVESGARIAAIVATMGTTDAFGIDDLQAIVAMRDRLVDELQLDYRPHVHADAVIGWAWSVFNDYDFKANELGFRARTLRALAAAHHELQHLPLADSIGIDFHKTGYTPYVSSLVLFRDVDDLQLVARPRSAMPYLFQSGELHPGMYTLETTRSGTGVMAALANLLLLGRSGLRVLLGNAVEMAEVLREQIEGRPELTVLNRENVGPVTLFRAYPPGTDTFTVKEREMNDPQYADQLHAGNEYNRRIFNRTHAEALAGRGVALSLTDCYRKTDYGQPMAAIKSYVLSPFCDAEQMQEVVERVLAARDAIEAAG